MTSWLNEFQLQRLLFKILLSRRCTSVTAVVVSNDVYMHYSRSTYGYIQVCESRQDRVFMNIFSRKAAGFYSFAKLFELNFQCKKNVCPEGQTKLGKSSSQLVNLPVAWPFVKPLQDAKLCALWVSQAGRIAPSCPVWIKSFVDQDVWSRYMGY